MISLKVQKWGVILASVMIISSCQNRVEETTSAVNPVMKDIPTPQLTLKEANRIAQMPKECILVEYPNKLGQVLENESNLKPPKTLHPAFYGCFDWHSSVHGHWSLVALLKMYPNLDDAAEIKKRLQTNMSKENILAELDYFNQKENYSYERPYGWGWFLKLAAELKTWDDPMAKELSQNLEPLVTKITGNFKTFLGKLKYPIRVGTHTNTAFGMSMAYDYAIETGDNDLKSAIETAAKRFYGTDKGCPLLWEPSGYDFLSPCLEEADLMRKVYSKAEYKAWLQQFLPQLSDTNFKLAVGEVSDRTDGHMVHLDGLNFSRAWCLYGIAETLPEYAHLKPIAAHHIQYSLPSIVDDNYEGTHWLGSFAIFALQAAK